MLHTCFVMTRELYNAHFLLPLKLMYDMDILFKSLKTVDKDVKF